MQPLVKAQPAAVPEGHATLAAHVGLLARVDAEVARERPRVAEAHAARRARVGPLARVDAQMRLQVLHAVEVPAAVAAVERAVARRELLLLRRAAAGPRRGAVGRFGAVVLALVPAQVAGALERPATDLAHVLLVGRG